MLPSCSRTSFIYFDFLLSLRFFASAHSNAFLSVADCIIFRSRTRLDVVHTLLGHVQWDLRNRFIYFRFSFRFVYREKLIYYRSELRRWSFLLFHTLLFVLISLSISHQNLHAHNKMVTANLRSLPHRELILFSC